MILLEISKNMLNLNFPLFIILLFIFTLYFAYIKMSEKNRAKDYYKKNRDIILNRAK